MDSLTIGLRKELSHKATSSALEFRCPHCQKLYTTDVSDVSENVSYFECFGCQTLFALECTVGSVGALFSTYIVPVTGVAKAKDYSQTQSKQASPAFTLPELIGSSVSDTKLNFQLSSEIDFKVEASAKVTNCPKCGSVSVAGAKECYSCGVIFERYQLAHSEGEWAVHPSLVRRWRELVIDFDNAQKHEDFIQECHSLNSLPFARKKYVEMKALLGQDSDCDRYIKRVDGVARHLSAKSEFVLGAKESQQKPAEMSKLRKTLFSIPFAISLILIVVGMAGAHQRNLIGLGISLAVLSYGLLQVTHKNHL